MGTRAAAFSAKVQNLQDYYIRLIHQTQPLPSGNDIANTLKSLSASLLGVLKDVPGQPFVFLRKREKEQQRLNCLPSLDYRGFHAALAQLLEVIPLITSGIQSFGQAVLLAVSALVPFLEQDLIDTLPYTVSTCLAFFPTCLQPDIIQCLCCHLFPYTIGAGDYNDPANVQATQSISAVLMMVLQFTTNNALHCQLLECLLQLRPDAVRHLLAVTAHSPTSARAPAANLLFHYWPSLNPTLYDRRNMHAKFTAGDSETSGWKAPLCQHESCPNRSDTEAVKLCEDHAISLILAPEKPPPIYLCEDCFDEIRRNSCITPAMVDVLLPVQQIALTCENKNCRSTEKLALFTCFSPECALYNTNRPLRYCLQCHNIRHNDRRGADHVVHTVLPSVWDLDPETQSYVIECVVSLLGEAQLHPSEKPNNPQSNIIIPPESERIDWLPLDERRLISRYGVWLLVSIVPPTIQAPQRALGRIVGMLFQWYQATAYLTDDQVGSLLEKLKSEILHDWVLKLLETHQNLVMTCLLPQAPDYARIGGSWDLLASKAVRVKEGIDRLFSLVPYEIINAEIWDTVMPEWISSIEEIIGSSEIVEIKNILGKMFDADMSPLGFEPHQLYGFITRKLTSSSTSEQETGLRWLKVLTQLEIGVPTIILIEMFQKALSTIVFVEQSPEESASDNEPKYEGVERPTINTSSVSDDEMSSTSSPGKKMDPPTSRLLCHVMMLDIIQNQLELQHIPRHGGTNEPVAKQFLGIIRMMISEVWLGRHDCKNKNSTEENILDCTLCDLGRMWTRLAALVLEFFCPECRTPQISFVVEQNQWKVSPKNLMPEKKISPERGKQQGPKEGSSFLDPKMLPGAMFISMSQVMTAKEETVGELEIAATMPSEKVVRAVAKAVPIAEDEVAVATVKVATVVSDDDNIPRLLHEDEGNFWQTTIGKFKFNIEDLPEELQIVYKILKELPDATGIENRSNFLRLLTLLILHEDALNRASKDHRGFFAWAQENLAISTFWPLLQESDSQSAQAASKLILHCAALPLGSEILWNLIESDFKDPDWKIRFGAVEKVYILAQMGDLGTIRGSRNLQSLMANAFCFLIGSLDDIKLPVMRRAQTCLECMNDDSLRLKKKLFDMTTSVTRFEFWINSPGEIFETYKTYPSQCLCWCLEQQFDCFVADRPQIIQCLQVLHNCLPKRKILSWNFFLERFDVIFIEVQIHLQKTGDIAYPRDLRNSDIGSDGFSKKLIRAQDSLCRFTGQQDTTKGMNKEEVSISAQGIRPLSSKIPPSYKRTMSAPSNIFTKTQEKESDKYNYSRQFSAPLLKNRPHRGYMDGIGKSSSIVDDSHVAIVLQRILQQNDSNAESLHLLTYLLMHFMCRSDQTSDEKMAVKNQSLLLRHLALMLGYSQVEKTFCITSAKLRSSPIFNAFISLLPKVMDCNIPLGNTLLQFALSTLVYCPAPQGGTKACNFSLWWLEPHVRKSWLHTLLVILYKYRYNHSPVASQVQLTIRIVLHTLHSHNHRCPPSYQTLAFINKQQHKHKDISRNSLSSEMTVVDSESCRTPRLILATAALTAHSCDVGRFNEINSNRRDSSSSGSGFRRPISETLEELDLEVVPENVKCPTQAVAISSEVFPEKLIKAPTMAIHEEIPVVAQVQKAITVQFQSKPVKAEQIRAVSSAQSQAQVGFAEMARIDERPKRLPLVSTTTLHSAKASVVSAKEIPEVESSLVRVHKGHTVQNLCSKKTTSPTAVQEMAKLMVKGPLIGTATVASQAPSMVSLNSTKVGEAIEVAMSSTVKNQRLGPVGPQVKPRQRRQGVIDNPPRLQRDMKQAMQLVENVPIRNIKQSSTRVGDECVYQKCASCGSPVEEFSDEELSLCVVIICTFVHRDPILAAPLLPEILRTCASLSSTNLYSWQSDQNLHIPGSSGSTARQFIRCVLHQLSPMGIFPLLFQTSIQAKLRQQFFSTMAFILADFPDLSPFAPLIYVLEQLTTPKHLSLEKLRIMFPNMSCYLECLPLDVPSGALTMHWSTVLTLLEAFFSKMASDIGNFTEKDGPFIFRILNSVMKCPGTGVNKEILEPVSKIVAYIVQHWNFSLKYLTELLRNSSKTYSRERERISIARSLVSDAISALRFKSPYNDTSLLYLTAGTVFDHGGQFFTDTCLEIKDAFLDTDPGSLCIAECLRPYMTEVLDFISDVHSLAKIKATWKINSVLFDEALGGSVKAGLSQWICMEAVLASSGPRAEPRMLGRLLPWLHAPPAPFQQGPREYLECLCHIRLISWLLNGALRHLATMQPSKDTLSVSWMPVQLDSSCQLAEHVQAIMAGFAEQSKASVLHMSSLFHAFLLCQLWTVYLEQLGRCGTSENHLTCQTVILDFWIKVTPSVLHLIAHSKTLSEMVSLHFLTMIESLRECQSSLVPILLPVWSPVLHANSNQLPSHLEVRYQVCLNAPPTVPTDENEDFKDKVNRVLIKWLQKCSLKMAQIELQSSAAAQLYTV